MSGLFDMLVDHLVGRPGVTPPAGTGGFGASAVKVDGRIAVMLVGGAVVMKLPRERVAALVADGSGAPFVSGRGSPMREWVTVVDTDPDRCRGLAEEACAFVGR